MTMLSYLTKGALSPNGLSAIVHENKTASQPRSLQHCRLVKNWFFFGAGPNPATNGSNLTRTSVAGFPIGPLTVLRTARL